MLKIEKLYFCILYCNSIFLVLFVIMSFRIYCFSCIVMFFFFGYIDRSLISCLRGIFGCEYYLFGLLYLGFLNRNFFFIVGSVVFFKDMFLRLNYLVLFYLISFKVYLLYF